MLFVLLLAWPVGGAWPTFTRAQLASLDQSAMHLPKAGGSTLASAVKMVRCEARAWAPANETFLQPRCEQVCAAYEARKRAGWPRGGLFPGEREANLSHGVYSKACAPMQTHHAGLQFCAAAHGLAAVFPAGFGNAKVFERHCDRGWPGPPPASKRAFGPGCAVCSTFLRDPWARAVSGWFYNGHHPSSDFFGVGWPPRDGFTARRLAKAASVRSPDALTYAWTEDGAPRSATFLEYANVATRFLGLNYHAYAGAAAPDAAALRRAVDVLRRVPFGLLEEVAASYALLAHALSVSTATCALLHAAFRDAADVGERRSTQLVDRDRRARLAGRATSAELHSRVAANATLRAAFEARNALDRALYGAATTVFCAEWRRAVAAPPGRSCLAAVARPPICANETGATLAALDAAYPPFPD